MMTNNNTSIEILVDAEHDSLRFVVAAIFIALTIISFLALSAFIPAGSINIIAIIGGLMIAAGGSYLIEQQLKRRWPSGKILQIDAEHIALHIKQNEQQRIKASPDVRKLFWRFEINRRSRVPKGWHMVAAALEDADEILAVYTLMPPDRLLQLNQSEKFTKLAKPATTTKGGKADDLRLAGEQKRLHKVEAHRWREGVEMTNDDFVLFVSKIEGLFPN